MGEMCSTHGGQKSVHNLVENIGRTIAQAVSRWLPTAAVRVRAPVKSCGICGGQRGTGIGFLQVLRFSLSSHSTDCSKLTIIHHPELVQRPNSGRRTNLTQFHSTTGN
jgi:hypothetical protein